jgi:hypothetical protein
MRAVITAPGGGEKTVPGRGITYLRQEGSP